MLQRLCQPMEPELREENGNDDCPASPHRSEETGSGAGKPQDMASEQAGTQGQQGQALDSWSPEDQGEQDSQCPQAKRPRSQGDDRFDPLAELYLQEPQQIDQAALARVRCSRHDDWLVDCGCRLEDSMLETLTLQRDRPAEADRGYEYVLVMEEEEENSVVKARAGPGMTVRRVCRVNPFRLLEYLQLTLEEAFFLVYALGCLSVYYNEVRSYSLLNKVYILLTKAFAVMVQVCLVRVFLFRSRCLCSSCGRCSGRFSPTLRRHTWPTITSAARGGCPSLG
uniref:Uncharacterized protein n=1 Tax=Hucho hucho TaxID=62062 RepID=A0A4W5LSX1_9TELE